MNHNQKSKVLLTVLTFCSLLSCVFLAINAQYLDEDASKFGFVHQYVKEQAYLPEVKFVKEILRNIFNVIFV
jgi:hypothetical protein